MKGSIEEETKTKTNAKEELVTLEMNYENLHKDYDRFREHLNGVILRELTGSDLMENLIPENSRVRQMGESSRVQLRGSPSDRTMYGMLNSNHREGSPSRNNNMYQSHDGPHLPTSTSTAALTNNDIVSSIKKFSR